MPRWTGVERFLVESAGADLRTARPVQPCLVAFRGEEALFTAYVRPFAAGLYHQPLFELFSLALPLEADRLAILLAGRAWSLEDPIPPVTEHVDLRQPVLIVHTVDGHGRADEPDGGTVLIPIGAGRLDHAERRELGMPEGWIGEAMLATIRAAGRSAIGDGAITEHAELLVRRGHELLLAAPTADRLGLACGAPTRGDR